MPSLPSQAVHEPAILSYDKASNLLFIALLQVKKGYVGIHSSGFKDFLLKPELLRAIQDCGFEHPSEGKFKTRAKHYMRWFCFKRRIKAPDHNFFIFPADWILS